MRRKATPTAWPLNRNHEAARRHVNQVLRDHGRPDYSRRETQIAELLDELIRERNSHRERDRQRRRTVQLASRIIKQDAAVSQEF